MTVFDFDDLFIFSVRKNFNYFSMLNVFNQKFFPSIHHNHRYGMIRLHDHE